MHLSLEKLGPFTTEIPALVRLKNQCIMLSTLAPSVLIGSSSVLKVTRTSIKSLITSNFSKIRPWTVELAAALERLKKST